MNQYFLSQEAEYDIDEIISFMAIESPSAAISFLDTLYETMDLLANNPFMGHRREDLTPHPVRFWPFKWHYLIIYKDVQPIEIARILSGYRDIASLLEEP